MTNDGGIQYQQQLGQQQEEQMEENMKLKAEFATALSKAQGQMHSAKKDSANPFFKSKYADLASVMEAIREPFANNGLSVIQVSIPSDKPEVCVKTVILHSSGYEYDCGVVTVPVIKNDAQGYGSANTYARRYGLQTAGVIPAEDDDGNAAVQAKPTGRPPIAKAMAEAHKPIAKDDYDALTPEQQDECRSYAAEVVGYYERGSMLGGREYLEGLGLDINMANGVWSQLDSKVRSAYKAANPKLQESK
jgi:hypothetical protein